MGVNPNGETELADFAPYWRVAEERGWGSNTLEVGTYGIAAHSYPGRDHSAGRDRIVDVGIDSQYQYSSGQNDVTVLANWLNENQYWDASNNLGSTSNTDDHLSTTTVSASYLYDKTVGPTVQYFIIDGGKDALLYPDSRTGSPKSSGWIFQIDYLPFNQGGGPSFFPTSNLKLTVQYILYNRFDGSTHNFDGNGRDAKDNNTLYLEAWLAF
jgi:hypothetical protein